MTSASTTSITAEGRGLASARGTLRCTATPRTAARPAPGSAP